MSTSAYGIAGKEDRDQAQRQTSAGACRMHCHEQDDNHDEHNR